MRPTRLLRLLTVAAATTVAPPAPTRADEKPVLVLDTGGHTGAVLGAYFLPGNKKVVTAAADNTVRVWNLETGKSEQVYRLPIDPDYEARLETTAISPDRRYLAVGGGNPFDPVPNASVMTHLIDLNAGKVFKSYTHQAAGLTALSLSPGAFELAAGSCTAGAWVWDTTSGRATALRRDFCCADVAFHPTAAVVAVSDYNHCQVFDIRKGGGPTKELSHNACSGPTRWDPTGTKLYLGGCKLSMREWGGGNRTLGFPEAEAVDLSLSHAAQVTGIAPSPDGKSVLVTLARDASPSIFVLDAMSGKTRFWMAGRGVSVDGGEYSSDSAMVVTTGARNDAEVWRPTPAGAAAATRLSGAGEPLAAAGWSADGKQIAWGWSRADRSGRGTQVVRSFDPGALLTGKAPDGAVRGKTADGNPALLEAVRKLYHRIDVVHNRNTHQANNVTLFRDRARLDQLAYALLGDGRILLADHWTVYLCDRQTGEVIRRYRGGHAGAVVDIAVSPDGKRFLTAGNDQTLKVWDVDRPTPLLSLFVTGQEWVAWVPEGYYASSPGGARMLGWQVDNAPDRFATYYTAEQFQKSLYRPDVIRHVLAEGGTAQALARAAADASVGGGTPKKAPPVEVGDVLPPRVRIVSPKADERLGRKAFLVEAEFEGVAGRPVVAVQLLVDGRPHGPGKAVTAPADKAERATWRLDDVTPGPHTLRVLARSAVSQGESAQVPVVVPGDEELRPRLFVLAVGAGEFQDGKNRLPRAAGDAEAMVAAFRTHSKALFREVTPFPGAGPGGALTGKDATRANILKGLSWFRQNMTPNDYGVVVFAGHGVRAAGGLYLLGHDSARDELASTAVPGSQFKDMLADTPGRIILFLDTCHAGAIDGTVTRNGDSPNDEIARDLGAIERGLVIFCSCTGDEVSRENQAGGFFTQAVVRGLAGQAQRTNGGVYLHQLDAYVKDRVREMSDKLQNPYCRIPPGITLLPLSRPAP